MNRRITRHIAPVAIVLTMLMTMLAGCQRKDLYLAQRGMLNVDVSVYDIQLDLLWGVDWSAQWQYLWDESLYGPIGYTEPSGVRANVYSIDENRVRSKYTTRNFGSDGGRVSLATKLTYDMMFHNNDTEYILFATDDATYYYATTRSSTKASYTRAYDNYNQPDQLFGVFLQNLYVSDDPEAYDKYIDDDGSIIYMYDVTADLVPYTFIYLYQVMLLNNSDDAGQRVTGCEGITVSGLAGGVSLFDRITDSARIVSVTQDDVKPIQTNRELILPDGTQAVGDIFAARIMTWGLPGIDPLAQVQTRNTRELSDSNYVGIGLTLRNGAVYPVQCNVTEQMKQLPAGGVITLTIDTSEIPDSIIGSKPQPGGGFDASVDNWENEIEADIVI